MSTANFSQIAKWVSDIDYDYPLSRNTTFRTGGPARVFARPKNFNELRSLWQFIHHNSVKYLIIGAGSNLLISDRGFDGVVFRLTGELAEVSFDGNTARAGAGASLVGLSNSSANRGLSGLEFACGIPGTIGGAVVMNAGAHQSEISTTIREIHTLTPSGEVEIIPKSAINWQYRVGLQNSSCIFTTFFDFLPKTIDIIQNIRDNFLQSRNASQPRGFSAGSVFKNPPGYKAWELIVGAGMKGYAIGDAVVSDQHANFILNRGEANSSNIYRLIRTVQKAVAEKYGVILETEIQLIGEFEE